jgi:hypothetical protein
MNFIICLVCFTSCSCVPEVSFVSESNLLCRVSWEGLPVDYVVDSLNILTGEKLVIHSMMTYEGQDKGNAYSLVYDDKGLASQLPEVSDFGVLMSVWSETNLHPKV